jgi:hypothetical protein
MPTVVVSIQIGVPPEVVARVLLDAELAPKWTSGLERLEGVEGQPGEVGCVGAAHYVEGRRRYILRDELLEVIPDRYFRSRVTGGGIDIEVETTLEPVGDSETRLSLRWVGRGTALVSRMILPFMTRRIARRADEDLGALRRIAESLVR